VNKVLSLSVLAIGCSFLISGEASPHLSDDFTESINNVRFMMKAIPAGTFMMGCGSEDEPCSDEEWVDKSKGIKQLQVTVESFYLAETEATWSLYQQCIEDDGCPNNDSDGGDNGWGKGNRPVIEVSWNDVTQKFIPWLNRKTKKNYRLPTEVEWAYAARAGTTTKYSWGNNIECSKARYGYVSGECGKQLSTDPVKSFQPNAFGLYDMHGNVWEYVQDCWGEEIDYRETFGSVRNSVSVL